jgi:GNAT superfamily N-acetyltransferase
MPDSIIRPMQDADLPAMRALHEASFAAVVPAHSLALVPAHATLVAAPAYAEDIRASDMWLAERSGALLGSAGWLPQENGAARIRKVFVHPDAARQGLGTRLVRAAEDRARAAGHTRFVLRAYLNAVPLYCRLGYMADREDEMPLPGGLSLPVLFMRKD